MPPEVNTNYYWNTTGTTTAGTAATWNEVYAAPVYNYNIDTKEDLEKCIRRIYKIITECVQLDITEEDFMKIMRG